MRHAFAVAGFRRLYATRLAGQFGDGLFQVSLAGGVLFNPERQASAADVAAGFVVVLLPYSLIGPFVGVLIDRWSRRSILLLANLVRAAVVVVLGALLALGVGGLPFYAVGLVIVSISRFVLAALGAALPRVLAAGELVTGNAFTTTSGAVAAALGTGAAVGLRAVTGSDDAGYAVIAASAAVPFVLAAIVAGGFGRRDLGPLHEERHGRESVRDVLAGLAAGARHVRERRPVLLALAVVGVHRLCYGVTLVCLLLLFRRYFHDDTGLIRSGLGGLGLIVGILGVGAAAAALVTPSAFRRVGPVTWPALALALSAVTQVALVLPYRLDLFPLAAFLIAFAGQALKISVDTVVQRGSEDEFRGRVFSLYDTLFNLGLVLAAVLTATVLPADGHAPASVITVAAAYTVAAGLYATTARRGVTSTAPQTIP